MARTKVFSKVKITQNYFEEFKEDFRELTVTALNLLQRENDTLSESDRLCINEYFGLEGVEPTSLKESLEKAY